MIKDYILSINIFSPLGGILLIFLISLFGSYGKKDLSKVKRNLVNHNWALIIGIIFGLIPLIITFSVSNSYFDFHSDEKFLWLKHININYHLAVDGLSSSMMLLTESLSIICMIVYWKSRKNYDGNPILAIVLILLLETSCLAVFSVTDLLLFYIFFEASLIPMLFIIGIWGREERVYAALKLFIYTVFGSVFFLFAILYLKSTFGTSEISELIPLMTQLAPNMQKYLWIAMFVAFAIKVPMLPFHTWLPDAHVQAPTFGSMMLAGVLIKMGAYAMIKFLIPLFPDISTQFSGFVAAISVIAIIYGSLLALSQKDIKRIIAYSSVSHMGYVTLGIFVPCSLGYTGAAFQMISHGFISSALFMCVGFIYERFHTLDIEKIHSLASRMKFFSIMFMIFTLGAVGLPGTSGFIGEFLVIVSAGSRSGYFIYAILAASGVILGAIYMLLLYKKVFMSHRDEEVVGNLETTKLENSLLVVFAVAAIYFGLRPMNIIEKIQKVNLKEYSNCKASEIINKGL